MDIDCKVNEWWYTRKCIHVKQENGKETGKMNDGFKSTFWL